MIIVDTSVWIDFLRGADTPQAEVCAGLIADGQPVALTDVILTEILQGLASDDEARLVAKHLLDFPVLRLEGLEDFSLAASIYRASRRAGLIVRNTLDCLIAAPCIRTGAPLLHNDADFDRLASCTPLQIWPG